MSQSAVCYRCETHYEGGAHVRCDCGEPLWFEADPTGFSWSDCTDAPGMWRYEALLPIETPDGIARGAGDTPLIRSEGLDDVAGCQIHVKDEAENPTGAYKDRGSAVAIPHAIESGNDVVGTVSYGNMAMSTAAHAASLDRECIVLVPENIPPIRLELIDQYGPTIVQVSGDYGKLYPDALRLSEELPIAILVGDVPARISGYKTALFEIYEAMAPETPDAIALPTSSGSFASGIWLGLRDLETAGLLEEFPRLYLVQTAAADPITKAFEAGIDDPEALSSEDVGETIAHSIGNPDPPSGARALEAARETGGAVLSVSDEEIRTAQREFAANGGFCVEPASATPLAGVKQLSERGDIGTAETVVLIPTGTGFKELGTGDRSIGTESVARRELRDRLGALLS